MAGAVSEQGPSGPKRGDRGLWDDLRLRGADAAALPQYHQGFFQTYQGAGAGKMGDAEGGTGGDFFLLRHHFHTQRHDKRKLSFDHGGSASEYEAGSIADQYGQRRHH